MKQFLPLFIPIIILSLTIPASCEKNFYVSLGGLYAVDDFDMEMLENVDMSFNFDDAMGINARIGYRFSKNLSFGVDVDLLRGFEWDMTQAVPAEMMGSASPFELMQGLLSAKAEFDFITAIGFAKVSMPGIFKPYFVGGIGYMRQDAELEYSASILDPIKGDSSLTEADYMTDQNMCAKAGIGIDIQPLDQYSFGVQGSYTAGFGDMDGVRYATITVGASFYIY